MLGLSFAFMDLIFWKGGLFMKLSWGPNETAYDAAYKVIKEKYPEIEVVSESFVVQLDVGGYDLTTLLIDAREYSGAPEV